MPAEESAHSSRVRWPIEIASRMPWPSSPMSRAYAPRNSTSEEAFDLLPDLSLRRWITIRLRLPSGSQPGTRKQETPRSVRASAMKTSRMRHREEPFMPGDAPAVAVALGDALRLAQIRAALLLGHRHADRDAGLVGGAGLARIVSGGQDLGLPLPGDLRIASQRRDRGVGHEDRAHDPVLALVPKIGERGAGDLRARALLGPAERMRLLSDGEAHELVPGRVELDLVDPVAEPVMRLEFRRMPVRLPGEELDMRAADRCAGLGKLGSAQSAPKARTIPPQGPVRAVGIVVGKGRRLVQHLVRGVTVRVQHVRFRVAARFPWNATCV